MISLVSERLAASLCKYIERTREIDYLRYGVEIIIRGFIKVFILLFTAYLIGLFSLMISILFTFVIFRFFTGGHHYSTYLRCLLVGLIMMLTLSFVAKKLALLVNNETVLILLLTSVALGLFL